MAPMYRKGDHTINVSGAEIEAQYSKSGYDVVQPEPEPEPDPDPVLFDPAEHSVAEVTTYLDGLDGTDAEARDAEVARVLEAERNGKNRSTLVGATPLVGEQGLEPLVPLADGKVAPPAA